MSWRKVLKENFTSIQSLCAFLNLNQQDQAKLLKKSSFVLNVPKRLAEKMEKGRLDDPLLRQFVPLIEESSETQGYGLDPVQDCHAALTPKLLQKYATRALLLASQACAMHCRYCFRKNYDYAPLQTGFEEELKRIREDKSLKEVILSGGDPLSLDNKIVSRLIAELSSLKHIRRIRFHTRFPIGIPERIDEGLLAILEEASCQVWFVIHVNHVRELDNEVLGALKKVQKLAIPVLSQTVLLKEVNDSLEALAELCETLVDNGIIPYYLHQLDRVTGTAHFEVDKEQGKQLICALNQRLSGYAVPKFVQEIPYEKSKTLIL